MNLSSFFQKHRLDFTLYGPRSVSALGLLILIFSPGFGLMLVLTGFAWGYSQHAMKTYNMQELIFVTACLVLGVFIFVVLIILTIRQLAIDPETSESIFRLLVQFI